MKKIVVLASLLVSLSFGLTKMQNYWTVKVIWDTLANYKKAGVEECKSTQDKVKGCYVHTKNEDGSSKQLVVYEKKEIIAFMRVFRTEIPMPIETGMIMCEKSARTGKCFKYDGDATEIEEKEFTGYWDELVENYVEQ